MSAHRVYISFAPGWCNNLVSALCDALTRAGKQPRAGSLRAGFERAWFPERQQVIDDSDAVLVILTSDAYTSDVCRAEQVRSLLARKHVIPILGEARSPIPDWFRQAQVLDLVSDIALD